MLIQRLWTAARNWRQELRARFSKYLVTREVAKVLALTHAQELAITPRNEWALVRSKQIEEIKAVRSGQVFDIVDRRSWCYSADTEVLTKRGWVLWPDVTSEDKLAIQTPSGHMSFSLPDHLVKFRYKGEMLHFKNRGVDFLVSPDHRLYGRKQLKSNSIIKKFEPSPRFYLAKDIAKLHRKDPTHDSCKFKVPVACLPVVSKQQDVKDVYISTKPRKGGDVKDYVVKFEDWISFVGLYASLGSRGDALVGAIEAAACPIPLYEQVKNRPISLTKRARKKRHYGVTICQSPGSRDWSEISALLDRMKLPYTVKSNGFHIHSTAVWKAIEVCGHNSYEKKLPRWIKNLPSEYLQIVLYWMLKGNGRKDKKDGTRSKRFRYKSASKRLADDVQEIALRIGLSAVIIPEMKIISASGRRQAPEYHVHEMSRREIGVELHSRVAYNGYIYCATVPGSLLCVRRSGKSVWSGNSYPYLPEALHRLNQPLLKNTPYSLRRFLETPIPRRAMNLIKNAVLSFRWQIRPTKDFIDDQDPDREQRIRIATETLRRPNEAGDSFRDLLEAGLEDFLSNGAMCIEHRTTPYFKRPTKMWAVDSSTIRLFLDWTESTPDRPRYAQMTGLKGERGIVTFLSNELFYIRDNIRTATPFGLGRAEIAFNSINAFLGVQDMSARAGSDQVHKTWLWWEQTLNPAHINTIRRHIVNELEGQAKISMIAGAKAPQVVEVTPVTPNDLLLDYQKFLIQIIAAAYDLSPQALNMDDHPARATAQVMADSDWKNGVVPVATRIQEAITRLWLHDILKWKDLEFIFEQLDEPDPMTRTVIAQRMWSMSASTSNEIRAKFGESPLPGPWGKLTLFQQQLIIASLKPTGGAAGGGIGGGMSSSTSGGGLGGGMRPPSTGSLGTGTSMNFTAEDIAGLQPDELQLYQELGIIDPDTANLADNMEQQSPGILDTLSDELTSYFQKELAEKEEDEILPAPVTPMEEKQQVQKFYEDSHQESLSEKVINRRGTMGPAINQQFRKSSERGKYPRSGGRFIDDQGKDRVDDTPIKTGKPKKHYQPGKNNPYAH